MAEDISHAGTEEAAPETPAPQQDGTMPNLHIVLWDVPPAYLCLACNHKDPDYASLSAHLTSTHGVTPLPTPLALDYYANRNGIRSLTMEPQPTYRTETTAEGVTQYVCLLCQDTPSPHWTKDQALMKMHQEQRHGGQMIEAKAEEPPPQPGQDDEGGGVQQADEAGDVPDPQPPHDPPPSDPPDHPQPEAGV